MCRHAMARCTNKNLLRDIRAARIACSHGMHIAPRGSPEQARMPHAFQSSMPHPICSRFGGRDVLLCAASAKNIRECRAAIMLPQPQPHLACRTFSIPIFLSCEPSACAGAKSLRTCRVLVAHCSPTAAPIWTSKHVLPEATATRLKVALLNSKGSTQRKHTTHEKLQQSVGMYLLHGRYRPVSTLSCQPRTSEEFDVSAIMFYVRVCWVSRSHDDRSCGQNVAACRGRAAA